MGYNYNLYANTNVGGDPRRYSKGGQTFIPARVIDVVLDDSHLEWNKLGQSQAIGAIKYALLNKNPDTSDPTLLPAAYPLVNDFKKLPLRNEIVLLVNAPSPDIGSNNLNTKVYYHTIVNLWNHPNHGGYPENDKDLDLGEEINESEDVNPLQPFPGDIILDGRQGQSIRLGGNKSSKNILTNNSNQGKPFTLISNGQKDADDTFNPIIEDINLDASSIYLTSDHKVPLEQANKFKRKSYGLNREPKDSDQYKGSQVLVNGGRLFFNAKDEGIFLNSRDFIGLQSQYINLDSEKEISLDSELIFLGEVVAKAPARSREPVLLGNQTIKMVNKLINIVKDMAGAQSIATDGKARKITVLNKAGKKARRKLTTLQRDTASGPSKLKSKKVFVE